MKDYSEGRRKKKDVKRKDKERDIQELKKGNANRKK